MPYQIQRYQSSYAKLNHWELCCRYALGGYDGNQMVSTVEVFDHCHSSWMLAESMNNSRGYFSIVVSGDAIYVLGGRQNDGRVLEHSKQPFVKMFLRNLWIVKRSFWCPFAASLPLSCEAWGSSWTAQNLIMPTL